MHNLHHLCIKDVPQGDPLLVEESCGRLAAIMQNLENTVVLQQGFHTLHERVRQRVPQVNSVAALKGLHLHTECRSQCIQINAQITGLVA